MPIADLCIGEGETVIADPAADETAAGGVANASRQAV